MGTADYLAGSTSKLYFIADASEHSEVLTLANAFRLRNIGGNIISMTKHPCIGTKTTIKVAQRNYNI